MEFAIVAPVFFMLLFGIIEAGRFILFYETLNNATREGTRYAIVNGANSLTCPTGPPAPNSTPCDVAGNDVRQRVSRRGIRRARGRGHGHPAMVPVRRRTCLANNGRGMTVTVDATYTYHALVPLVPLPPITITARSSLVINN